MGARRQSIVSSASAPSEHLAHLYARQAKLGGPRAAGLEVDFQELFPDRSTAERATHLIHPYPAKLVRNIPRFFLECESIARPGGTVLDPFCGSGTVLLEASLAGFKTVGADSNPLARLIALAKVAPPDPSTIKLVLSRIMDSARSTAPSYPDVVNVDHWFYPRVKEQLGRLHAAVKSVCGEPFESPFFWTCFSSCVKRVSLADPRLSVPVRINPERAARYGAKGDQVIARLDRLSNADVFQVFWQVATANLKRVERLRLQRPSVEVEIYDDARSIDISDGAVQLILTSPPYVGAQKYIRASSLSLGWLGLSPSGSLRPLERKSIGREHLGRGEAQDCASVSPTARALLDEIRGRNPARADIASTYLAEMYAALKEAYRLLAPTGKMVLVAGPNMVAGLEFDTPGFLSAMAQRIGFHIELHLVDSIASRGLMTKRNKTAGTISQEAVYVLAKSL